MLWPLPLHQMIVPKVPPRIIPCLEEKMAFRVSPLCLSKFQSLLVSPKGDVIVKLLCLSVMLLPGVVVIKLIPEQKVCELRVYRLLTGIGAQLIV